MAREGKRGGIRLLTATIPTEQARKFLLWGARGHVLLVREAIPGRGSQVRGWMTCATLSSCLLGRPYWVWTPHGLHKLLLREPNVCRSPPAHTGAHRRKLGGDIPAPGRVVALGRARVGRVLR